MKQGEIWQIGLDPVIGAEMKKTRPGLVINSDTLGKLPLKIIVPITEWKEHYSNYPWMVKIIPSKQNGLIKFSAVDWKAGVHTSRLAAVQKETLIMKFKHVGYRGMAPASTINFLSKEDTPRLVRGVLHCFQIRSVSVERLITQVGSVESETITQVQEAVNQVIGIW